MKIVCTNKRELKEAIKRKPDYIIVQIALFKNYEIEAEYEDGRIKFKVKRRLQ